MWVELPYLFLHVDDDELHGEADDVAGVQAVPDGQEQEGGHLREDLIAQELQPLEHMPSKTQAQRGTPPSRGGAEGPRMAFLFLRSQDDGPT